MVTGLAIAGIATIVVFLGLTVASVYLHRDPEPMPKAQAIIVLSGPGALETIPVDDTRERVERGVALWHAGHAPLLVMSGAGATLIESQVPDSTGMRLLAEQLGVPPEAILEENNSFSTLQNAWNTARLPEIDPNARVVVVTNRYHLLRSRLSFWWAGFGDVTPAAADSGTPELDFYVLMEGVKWPFNILRALGASAALAAGLDENRVWTWLE